MIVDKLTFPVYNLAVTYATPPASTMAMPIPLANAAVPAPMTGVGGTSRLSITILKENQNTEQHFNSYRDLLTTVFATELIDKEKIKNISIYAARQANLIATRTRRGAANVVTTSSNTIFDLDKNIFNSSWIFETTDALEDDELMVRYEGTSQMCDGAFLAEILPDGKVKAFVKTSSANTLGSAADFGVIMKVA